MNNNYYLNLLKKKLKELEKTLNEIDNENYTHAYKKYLISGYIITLDSILEIGIGDLHSSDLDEIASLIYYTRQKAVHYGYFNGLDNIEETAEKLIELIDKNYEDEQKYYNSVLTAKVEDNYNNMVIKTSAKIEEDGLFYRFKSLDDKQILCVPLKSVFKLTKKHKDKVSSYIVDTSKPIALYSIEGEKMIDYKEIKDEELKDFFNKNFNVLRENYNEHMIVMQNILNSFVRDPINSIQIMEYASDEQFCRNTIDVIYEFVTENCMNEAYVNNNHLIKDKYSLNKMQKTDYIKLQHQLKKQISKSINYKDAFFIEMTIKRAKYYMDILRQSSNTIDTHPEVLCPMLVQLFETGPKHFSNKFISSSPEFKKCYSNLQRYRQVFSHYVLLGKEYRDNLEKFYNEFLGFIHLLQIIDLSEVKTPVSEDYNTCLTIEREKKDFFNYKHEQYLKIHNSTYIGKKIHYSSHNQTSKSLIAIMPGGNNAANIMYYKKDTTDYISPKTAVNESGKRVQLHALNTPLRNPKQVKIDYNLANLFEAYHELKKQKNKSSITIAFNACEENSNYAHYDDLETVILRFFNQGYLPAELLQKTKLDISNLGKGIIYLTDVKGNSIATISNKLTYNNGNYNKDDKNFFSRIDDITHDFSKRRHKKW